MPRYQVVIERCAVYEVDAHDQIEKIDLTRKGLKVMQIGYRKLFSTLDLSANA